MSKKKNHAPTGVVLKVKAKAKPTTKAKPKAEAKPTSKPTSTSTSTRTRVDLDLLAREASASTVATDYQLYLRNKLKGKIN